jgi:gas vesicle protein GvpG
VGLITGLVTLPLAPVRGVAWIAEKLAEEAENELYDEARIMRELAELDGAHERGEIGDDLYESYADELLYRLEMGRQLELERSGLGG